MPRIETHPLDESKVPFSEAELQAARDLDTIIQHASDGIGPDDIAALDDINRLVTYLVGDGANGLVVGDRLINAGMALKRGTVVIVDDPAPESDPT